MTHVYFVRHAESDHSVRDDRSCPLTEKGRQDSALVAAYLADKGITGVYSSPFRRARDTLAPFASSRDLAIQCDERFRERRIAEGWIEDSLTYARRQWGDFGYALPGGESLGQVQARNIEALRELLAAHPGAAIAIGTHGTALSTVVHHFDSSFGYRDFAGIIDLMPWVVHLAFEGEGLVSFESVDLFEQ